jgi:hypothetical protein
MQILSKAIIYLGPVLTLVALIIACTWQPRRGKTLICIYLLLLLIAGVLFRVVITLVNRDVIEWSSLTARSLNISQIISYHLAEVTLLIYLIILRKTPMWARSEAVSGGRDTSAADCPAGPSASEREPTEPTISQDRPSPMPQREPSSKPSRACSIPGVIAGLLVMAIGVGNLLIHKRDGMEPAMNLWSSGAWLFAGGLIIVRSFLGPFGLLKLFLIFFGGFLLWLNVPLIPHDFRMAQAAMVKSEAYGGIVGRLLVIGLGILLLVFGLRRRKAVSCTTHEVTAKEGSTEQAVPECSADTPDSLTNPGSTT